MQAKVLKNGLKSREYYMVPLESGKYEMEVRIVCEEFVEEDIQKYEIIVE